MQICFYERRKFWFFIGFTSLIKNTCIFLILGCSWPAAIYILRPMLYLNHQTWDLQWQNAYLYIYPKAVHASILQCVYRVSKFNNVCRRCHIGHAVDYMLHALYHNHRVYMFYMFIYFKNIFKEMRTTNPRTRKRYHKINGRHVLCQIKKTPGTQLHIWTLIRKLSTTSLTHKLDKVLSTTLKIIDVLFINNIFFGQIYYWICFKHLCWQLSQKFNSWKPKTFFSVWNLYSYVL